MGAHEEIKARHVRMDSQAREAQRRFEEAKAALKEEAKAAPKEEAKTDLKFDHEKPMPHLVFDSMNLALMEVVKVATFGARKYEPESWKQVANGSTRYKSALYRHLLDPQELDGESELDHLAHVAWNALALLQLKMEQEKWTRTFKNN